MQSLQNQLQALLCFFIQNDTHHIQSLYQR